MKVIELGGFSNGNLNFYAYYRTKIDSKDVILTRTLNYDMTGRASGVVGKLDDSITDIYCCIDEKDLEEVIQNIIELQNEHKEDIDESNRHRYIEPFQMQNGREIDLNLANISIVKAPDLTDNDVQYYQYIVNKKVEELKLDRLEQLKKATQNNPDFYCLETYLETYENQSGNKLSELQIERIRDFVKKIQDGVIIGKYNLKDYNTFLQLIPDLLSGKKALAIGHFDQEGDFWIHGEIYEKQLEKKDISQYTTYTYHRLNKGENRFANDNFKIIPSPSIQKRMSPILDELCGIDLDTECTSYFDLERQKTVKPRGAEKHPNIKIVGKR